MVDSAMSNGLDGAPMAILRIAETIKLFLYSISGVAEKSYLCTNLIEVVHDLNKLSESFDWGIQF